MARLYNNYVDHIVDADRFVNDELAREYYN
jgi:hypothetical protein